MSDEKQNKDVLFCSKCGSYIHDNQMNCKKCNSFLENNTIKKETVSIERFRELEEKYFPSFKLTKWYHTLFYLLGWLFGFANILFWIILFYVKEKNKDRYDHFMNPAMEEFVFWWGIVFGMIISFLILSIFLE